MPLPEKPLIADIRRRADTLRRGRAANRRPVRVGIGDDCSVLRLRPGQDALITTDFSLDGVHFRRDWHSAESVGYRCLARGLSDIASMGGDPVAVFLSLALPGDLPQSWVVRFTRSLVGLAEEYGATLAGGDTATSPGGVLADIVVLGSVPEGTAILRSGARPGDRIFVSGQLGGSAAAVMQMKTDGKVNPRHYPRHFFPEPRIELGRILREKGMASSMIDTSDGLSTDLAHICEESGVGAEIEAALIPRARLGRADHEVDLDIALHGGEDYELLFTVPPGKRVPARLAGINLTCIGQIMRGRRILLRQADGTAHELLPGGWEHFR